MNLAQIIETLPPRVYLRCGELVIHFSTPGDLVARVAETQAALSALERPELTRSDTRMRGRTKGAFILEQSWGIDQLAGRRELYRVGRQDIRREGGLTNGIHQESSVHLLQNRQERYPQRPDLSG